ncbi:cytosolic 5'-nucleotidase 3-like isoform X2 [Lineus longissimus]|uniref:cytosolic 5'-nucleotidase 3-like isoform X2 n=1 Tax=Lineus longissimus TaxID=88925 RepID=UPI00315CABC8
MKIPSSDSCCTDMTVDLEKSLVIEQMEELQAPHVHMEDPQRVASIIEALIEGGKDKLQVIADFDRTLSRFSFEGDIVPTCHGIIDESTLLPESYRIEATTLRNKYYAIEMDPDLTSDEKKPYMVEWYTKAHKLMVACNIRQQELKRIVRESGSKLREGCDSFFKVLDKNSIPLLIFSAGIGDIIQEIIEFHTGIYDNMKIVSNFMDFNGSGLLRGFRGELIHTFNKNEGAIGNSDYFGKLRSRENAILMGDTIGDLKMADGAGHVTNILKIGFLNDSDKVEHLLPCFKANYDIVLVGDETVSIHNALLNKII